MIMLPLLDSKRRLFVTTEDEALIAREAVARLQPIADAMTDTNLDAEDAGVAVTLPSRAVGLIDDILIAVADRKPISIVPHEDEVTTQQAADFLNVSLPYLVGLLGRGKIPHYLVGTHCRLLTSDLIAYRTRSDEARATAIADDAREVLFPQVHPFERSGADRETGLGARNRRTA
jgi:excisionase family DNA binding protein